MSALLHLLSSYEHEVSVTLIETDEDELISKPDAAGWTALHYACHKGNTAIVKALCSRQACSNLESSDHWTPLQLATYHGNFSCQFHTGVKVLLKAPDIQVNRMTQSRPPPLHIAVKRGAEEIVERLLQMDASLSIEGPDGKYPFELTENSTILEMLPKYQGEKEIQKYSILHDDISDFYGKAYLTGTWVLNDKEVFLSLKLSKGLLEIYNSQDEFLSEAAASKFLKLVDIYGAKECNPGIFSEKGKFYFILTVKPRPIKLYTEHQGMTKEWIKRIQQGVNFALEKGIGFLYSAALEESRPSTPESEGETAQSGDDHEDASTPGEVVNFSNFTVLEELGSGSFGKVYKALKTDTQQVYAVKCLNKQHLLKHKQLHYAISECKIMKSLNHPFILQIHYAFQTPRNLYMVLDYCPNGDLLAHLQESVCLSESICRFYCSEILLALEYLHSLDIVYRDLKPENILLDHFGHVKMADFGLAKENVNSMNLAMSFCGSPAYLSPELVNKEGSDKSADVYAFGALVYELLTGLPPFFSENIYELFHNIRRGQLAFPAVISPEARDLIKKVMQRETTKRPTVAQLKHHPFFSSVDWEATLNRQIRPPRLAAHWKQVQDLTKEHVEVDFEARGSVVSDVDYEEGEAVDPVEGFS